MNVIDQTYDEAIPVRDLAEHPDNPRRGRDAAVSESIKANGFFGAILVQKSSGLIIAGNTRWRAANEAGNETIPGFWVDCDDEAAKRILLADNRVSDLADYDERAVMDLLLELSEAEDGLAGTGYDETAMALLSAALEDVEVPEMDAPESFPVIDPEGLNVEYRCPSCSYEWSGSPRPGAPSHEPSNS